MKKLIARIAFPRMAPEQVDREIRNYLVAIVIGLAFAAFIAAFAIQRYHQL
jgi:hypothetical protein